MFRTIIYIFLLLLLVSCGASKKRTTRSKEYKVTVSGNTETKAAESVITERNPVSAPELSKADAIINTALTFSGVRYKYGGTTKKGVDCSGLLYVSFAEHDEPLPRVSYVMANEGKRIRLREVTKGDLLFFRTSRRAKRINHVGLVVAVENDEIKFIHASSSRGVIVSSLREGYWNHAFVKATRVL